MAARDDGRFVVAWTSHASDGGDTSGTCIRARRFEGTGLPAGPDFQVNSYTTGDQRWPAVAVLPLDRFVVAWHSDGSSGSDTSESSVQAQLYDADGSPLGGEFQVNTYTTGLQGGRPAIVATGPLTFVIVWESLGSFGTDDWFSSVQARRFQVDGSPLGPELQVNTYTAGVQGMPTIGFSGQGNVVVAYVSDGSAGTDTSDWSIQAQRFDPDGLPVGGEFQVNTYTTEYQLLPALAAGDAGGFVIAWQNGIFTDPDGSGPAIQAQRFDSDANPLGTEFQVNTVTTNPQTRPSVAGDPSGGFLVAWDSGSSNGTDTDVSSIQAQRFDPDGLPVDGEFQVNTYTTDAQSSPSAAADGSGNFVVTWESVGSYGTDTERPSIEGQLFDALFRDGFESGDTTRWSAAVP